MSPRSLRSIKHPKTQDLIAQGANLLSHQKYSEAVVHFENALKRYPKDAHLHYSKGVAHHKNKEIIEAIGSYSEALQINTKFLEAFENLAEAQVELGLFPDALLSIKTAISLNPKRPISYTRLARILIRLGQAEEAVDMATYSISLEPENSTSYMIRSNAYRALNYLDKSIADLRRAIELAPENNEYTYNLSFDLLLDQQFEEGWECYEARFQTENFIENTPEMYAPLWRGAESISGKTILVCPEQGLGDQIQFSRYALVLKAMGADVILAVSPNLVQIIQSMHPDIHVTSSLLTVGELPKHDFYVPLMSLLGIFKTDIDSIPCADRYISPDLSLSEKWAARFINKEKLQIGITWSGSRSHVNDHNRSMSLEILRPLFNLDADWHVVQTEIRPDDANLLNQLPMTDWRHELTNLHETAALLDQLDLLITVDTSVAHLSAALGRPTWIMLPYAPDFRWLLNRKDSPWYPSVQLIRQVRPNDWSEVLKTVMHNLTNKY